MDPALAMGAEARRIWEVARRSPGGLVNGGPDLAVTTWAGGFRLAWPEGGEVRSFATVRALDHAGNPLTTSSPFCDPSGNFFWARAIEGHHLWVPDIGLPAGAVRLRVDRWRLSGSRASADGFAQAHIPAGRGRPWSVEAWAAPLVVLAVAVIHADGRVQRTEAEALLDFARDAGIEGIDWTAALLRPTPALLGTAVEGARLRWPDWGPRTLLERLITLCGPRAGEAERRVLMEIGGWLGAPSVAVDHLFQRRGPVPDADLVRACEVLGVPAGATPEEARAAWRARVAASHPDRVARAGQAAVLDATRRVQALNAAWQVLEGSLSASVAAPPRAAPEAPAPASRLEGRWARLVQALRSWAFWGTFRGSPRQA